MSQGHTPQDLIYELTDVSGPSLSPDGTQLVFVRSKVDKQAMETRSQIMRMEMPTGEAVSFTSGQPIPVSGFGLEDGRSRTLEEVGRDFGVTRERIRQIEAKALRKLRHPSRSKKLRDFLE